MEKKRRTVALWALGAVLVMGSICLTAVHTDTAEAWPFTAVSDVKISQTSERGGLLSRTKRNVLFPSGVKICDQETLDQAVSNHLEYYHLRVCQDTVWEAFKIFWDRLPEGDEYHDWVDRCLHGSLSVKEIGAHFSQSEEHIHLVRSRIAMDTARNSTEDMQFQSDHPLDTTGDNDVTTSGPITAVGVDLVFPPYTRVTPEIHEVVIATTTGSDITVDVVTKEQGHDDVTQGHAHGAVPLQVAAATAVVPAEALAYDTHKPTGQEVGGNTILYMVEEEAVGGDTEEEESEHGGTEREASPGDEQVPSEEEESPQTSAIPARGEELRPAGEELRPEVPAEVPHAEVTLDSVLPDDDVEVTPDDVGWVPTALEVQAEEQATLEGPDSHVHDLEVQAEEQATLEGSDGHVHDLEVQLAAAAEEDEVGTLEEPDSDIQLIPGGSPSEVAAEVTRPVDEAASQTRPTVAAPDVSPHSETWTEAPPLQSEAPPLQSEAPPLQSGAPSLQSEAPPLQSEAPPLQSEAPPLQSEVPPLLSTGGTTASEAPGDLREVARTEEPVLLQEEDSQISEGGGAGEELLQGALEEVVMVREAAEESSEEEIAEAEREEDETSQEEEAAAEEGEIPDETQEDKTTGKEGVEPAEDPTLEPADIGDLAEESVEFAGETQEVAEHKEEQETTGEQTEETTEVTAEDEAPEEPEPEVMEAEFMEAEIVDDAIQQTVDETPVDSEEEVTSLAVDLQEDSEEVTSLAVDLQEDSEEVTSLAVDLQEDSEEVTSLAVDLQEDSEEVTSLAVDLQDDLEEASEDEAVTETNGGETDVPAQRPVQTPGGPVDSPRGSTVEEAPPPEFPSEAAVEEMVRSSPEHTTSEEETGEGMNPEPTLVPGGDAEEARGEEPTQKIPEDIGDVSPDIRLEAEDLTLDSLLEITPETSDDITPDSSDDITPEPSDDITPDSSDDITPDSFDDITSDSPGDVTNDDLLGNDGFALDEAQDNTIGNEVDESLRRPVGPVREQLVDLSIKLRGHSYHDDLRDPSSFYYQQLSKRFTAKIKEAFERLPGFKNAFVVEFRPQKDLDRGVVVSVHYSVLVEVDGSGLSGATMDLLTSQSLLVERSWTEQARLVHTVTDLRNHIVQALHNNNFMNNSTLDLEPPPLGLQNVKNVFPSERPTSPPVDSFVSLDNILTAEKPPDVLQQEVGGVELYLRKEDFPLDSFDQLTGPQAASVNDVLLLDESTAAPIHLAPTVAGPGAKEDEGFVSSHSAGSSPSSSDHGEGSGSGSSGDGAVSEAWPRRPTSTEEEEELLGGGGLEVLPPPDLEEEEEEEETEEEEEEPTAALLLLLDREVLVTQPHLTPTGPPVLWTAQNLVVEELSMNPVEDLVQPREPSTESTGHLGHPGEPSTESTGHLGHPGEPSAVSTGPVEDDLLQTNEEEEKHFILLPDEEDDDEDDVQVLEEQEVVFSDSVTEATAAGLSEQDLTEDEVMEVVAPETLDHNAPLSPEAESPFTRVSDTAPPDDDDDHHDNGDNGHSEDGMVSLDNGHAEDGIVALDNGAEVFIADPPEGAETAGVLRHGDTPLADEEELTSSDEVTQEAEPGPRRPGAGGWTAGTEGSGFAGTDLEPAAMPTAQWGVALSPGGGAPSPEGGALTVFFSLRVTNMKFSMDLFNKSSEEYKHLEQQFIQLLVPFLQSNLSSFRQLEILNFRNGSVVVNSRMRVASPVPGGVASVVYLILENVVESAHQTMDLDIHTLDVESGDKADPCKFQACNEFSACRVNRWSGVAECVCRHGYVSLDGTPCRSLCDADTPTHYCHNHGTCDVIAGRGAVCRCAAGYHGQRCEAFVSEAEPVVVAAAMASVAGFLMVASGAVYFLLRLLREQNRPPDDTEKCHGNSVPSLDRGGKFNPAFQGDRGYRRYDDEPPEYYRRLDDDLPPYLSTLPPAGEDRHDMTPEELQHRLKVIESHTRDQYLADYIRQTHVFLERRRSSTT